MARTKNNQFNPVKKLNSTHWVFASSSDWQKLCGFVRTSSTKPSMPTLSLHAKRVDLHYGKDWADKSLADIRCEADTYELGKREDKDDVVIRRIASKFVYFPNRSNWWKLCRAIDLSDNVQLIHGWQHVGGVELPQTNGQLDVHDITSWNVQNYDAEYRRVSGLAEILQSLLAMQADADIDNEQEESTTNTEQETETVTV